LIPADGFGLICMDVPTLLTAANSKGGWLPLLFGGLAAAAVPRVLRGVRGWAVETRWLLCSCVGLLLGPLLFAAFADPGGLAAVLGMGTRDFGIAFAGGAAWGMGMALLGPARRHLGRGWILLLGGNLFGLLGAWISGWGMVRDFPLGWGMLVLGLTCLGGAELARKHQESRDFSKGLPLLVLAAVLTAALPVVLQGHGPGQTRSDGPVFLVALAGGFVSVALVCLYWNYRHKTMVDYFNHAVPWPANLGWVTLAGLLGCLSLVCLATAGKAPGKLGCGAWGGAVAAFVLGWAYLDSEEEHSRRLRAPPGFNRESTPMDANKNRG
jgi:L-rhamnose-H+ transport protein